MALSRGSEPPKIFASHPPSQERLENMQRRLDKLGPTQPYLEPDGDGYRLTEAGVEEIKAIALQAGDFDDAPRSLAPKLGGSRWPVLEQTPTREALFRDPAAVTVRAMRQQGVTEDGVAVAAEYLVFDSPEAAHWALTWAALVPHPDADNRPAASTEADELWRSADGSTVLFRKGQVVGLVFGALVVSDRDRLVTAIARRIAMPAPTTELEGAPTLITADALLAGPEYADVRDDTIGLTTDGWRALGVTVTVKGDRATLSRDERTVVVRVNSNKAEANGVETALKAKPWAIKKRMYIPVEDVGETLAIPLIAAPDSALVVVLD